MEHLASGDTVEEADVEAYACNAMTEALTESLPWGMIIKWFVYQSNPKHDPLELTDRSLKQARIHGNDQATPSPLLSRP